jgi:hypothetical protein
VFQHSEQQTLEQLYGSRTEDTHDLSSPTTRFPQLERFNNKLNNLRLGTLNNASMLHSSALEEVEQEREVQKALHYEAHAFPGIHPAISSFVSTGHLCGDVGYEHMFDAVSHTSLSKRFGIVRTESRLFVSVEFMKTIKTDRGGLIDNFLVSSSSFASV